MIVTIIIIIIRDGQRNGTRGTRNVYWPFRSGTSGTGIENQNYVPERQERESKSKLRSGTERNGERRCVPRIPEFL